MRRLSKFVASILAVRYSGKGEEIGHFPIFIEADNQKEADEKAKEIALQRWPKAEGWAGHNAVSVLR